ncbi:hypothetical protein MMC18_006228 [Xylographa bjoerkii]|nr:hypothetical protein [Xylographa bjoerkii]
MEALDFRLQGIEQVEIALTAAWAEIVNKQEEQDLELSRQREAEDVKWRKRPEKLDREEDALRQDKRGLSRGAITPFMFGFVAISAQESPTAAISGSSALLDNSKKHPKDPETDKRFHPRSPADNRVVHPSSLGLDDQLLFTRPSDGALVSLRCCVGECENSDFDPLQGLRVHVTRVQEAKDLLESMAQAIEKCKVLVAEKRGGAGEDIEFGTLSRPIEVDSDPEVHSVKAERVSGAESLKDRIVPMSETEEGSSGDDTQRALGFRVKRCSLNGTAIERKGSPGTEHLLPVLRHHMDLRRSPKPSRASTIPDPSSESEPLMKRVRRHKDLSRVS